jgi:ankyrin repeat protein
LVENGADIDNQTILHYAARGGSIEIVEFLLNGGANINHRDRFGETALIYAAKKGNMEISGKMGKKKT